MVQVLLQTHSKGMSIESNEKVRDDVEQSDDSFKAMLYDSEKAYKEQKEQTDAELEERAESHCSHTEDTSNEEQGAKNSELDAQNSLKSGKDAKKGESTHALKSDGIAVASMNQETNKQVIDNSDEQGHLALKGNAQGYDLLSQIQAANQQKAQVTQYTKDTELDSDPDAQDQVGLNGVKTTLMGYNGNKGTESSPTAKQNNTPLEKQEFNDNSDEVTEGSRPQQESQLKTELSNTQAAQRAVEKLDSQAGQPKSLTIQELLNQLNRKVESKNEPEQPKIEQLKAELKQSLDITDQESNVVKVAQSLSSNTKAELAKESSQALDPKLAKVLDGLSKPEKEQLVAMLQKEMTRSDVPASFKSIAQAIVNKIEGGNNERIPSGVETGEALIKEGNVEFAKIESGQNQTHFSSSKPEQVKVAQGAYVNASKISKEGEQDTASLESDFKQLAEDSKVSAKQTEAVSQVTPRVEQVFKSIQTIAGVISSTTASITDAQVFTTEANAQLESQVQNLQQANATTQSIPKSHNEQAMQQAINIARNDVAKVLQERVNMMLNINNQEAEIRLDPPELGAMQIRIRGDAEQAQVNFVVQNQQAKELLEQSMSKLKEMLEQQGIMLGDSEVSHQGEGQQQSNSEHSASGGKLAAGRESEQIAEQSTTRVQNNGSGIDYYA